MATVLDRVNSPLDLQSLTLEELEQLASEIRHELISTVSENGGHLASNLGVVELTLALHRVFSSPQDKLIWDVGHQSYVHKLLTGRRPDFTTLRQYGGLSGFADPMESPHDPFIAGHAGNSLSAALGIALARDLANKSYQVVSIIGDGSFGAGMAFEALNHTGHLGIKVIIVLNDNGMAISPSIGAFARLMNRVRLDYRYEQAKGGVKRHVARLPMSKSAWAFSKEVKSRLKRALLPVSFWEQFGFVYLGPIDGHDLVELEAALHRARDYESGPTLVHVVTRKGKDYPPAESDAIRFHGVSPNGGAKSPTPSYSEVFGQTAVRLLRENDKVVVITAAMMEGTGVAAAAREFPRRVFDVGICEQHAVTMAAGLAAQGFIPVVAIYSTFLQRAYDQLIHDVCIPNLPVVFAVDRAGIVGEDGKTHQGAFDISYLRAIPNMVVAAPRDENELQRLLFTAIHAGCPMAVRYPRDSGRGVPMQPEWQELSIGKGQKLMDGCDVGIVAIGPLVYEAIEAAQQLAWEGIECAVIDARYVKPLDAELIVDLAHKTRRLVTVEENAVAGGFGSAVLQLLEGSSCEAVKVECIGLPDRFIEHGPQELFRSLFDLTAKGICGRVRKAFPELWVRTPASQQ
jgi:1-deoxy-D-xylulose-5-phosphate synthase